MWGNRLGWSISAVLLLLVIALVGGLYYLATATTPPTGWVDKDIQAVALPDELTTIVPEQTDSTDAGPLYRKAIEDAIENPSAYVALTKAKDINPSALDRPGIKAMLDATRCNTLSLFHSSPEEIVNYQLDHPVLKALDAVSMAMQRTASLFNANNNPKEARRYWNAVYALGLGLYRERVSWDELFLGQEYMGTAIAAMQRMALKADDTPTAMKYKGYGELLSAEMEKMNPIKDNIRTIDDRTITYRAGDYLQLMLAADKDPMWRAEAALALGRLKYNANRRGDQLNAQRTLKKLAGDAGENPIVRAAATVARDLTIEQYRQLQ